MAQNKLFGMMNAGGDMNLSGIPKIKKPKKLSMKSVAKKAKPIKMKKPKGLKGF